MKKLVWGLLAAMITTQALAHGGHTEMVESVHAVHHGLEWLALLGLAVGVIFALVWLKRKLGELL